MENKRKQLKIATPRIFQVPGPKLVFNRYQFLRHPEKVALRFVRVFTADGCIEHVEFIHTRKRMPKAEFITRWQDGEYSPTPETAVILGKVKPSRQSEIMHSETYESPRLAA